MATKPTEGKQSDGWAKAPKAAPKNFREVSTDFVRLDEIGKSVAGTLVDKSEQVFRAGAVGKYKIQTDDEKVITILGATDLDDKLAGVPEGEYVRITLVDAVKTSGGQKMKVYKVEIAE